MQITILIRLEGPFSLYFNLKPLFNPKTIFRALGKVTHRGALCFNTVRYLTEDLRYEHVNTER